MPRFAARVESAAALASGTAFAALTGAAGANGKLTRVWLGTSISGAITSQQVVVGLNRATARGTVTTTQTGQPLDPNSAVSAITGLDTVWSVAPTLGANYLTSWEFNTQAGMDVPVDLPEEYIFGNSTAAPLVFVNLDNALPSNHKVVLGLEWVE